MDVARPAAARDDAVRHAGPADAARASGDELLDAFLLSYDPSADALGVEPPEALPLALVDPRNDATSDAPAAALRCLDPTHDAGACTLYVPAPRVAAGARARDLQGDAPAARTRRAWSVCPE